MDTKRTRFFTLQQLLCCYVSALEQHSRPKLPWASLYFRNAMVDIQAEINQAFDYHRLRQLILTVQVISQECDIWLPNELRGAWEQFSKVVRLAEQSQLEYIDWRRFHSGFSLTD